MMLPLLPLVLAFSMAAGSPSPRGKTASGATRKVAGGAVAPQIVGGYNATSITELPWQVFVSFAFASGDAFNCGGSVIDDDWVLTAAHCVVNGKGEKAVKATAMFGSTLSDAFQPKKMVMYLEGSNLFPHEQYNTSNYDNDIALMKLDVPLPIKNNKRIAVIKLPKSADAKKNRTFAGSNVILSGWGKTNDSEPGSPVLKGLNTVVLSHDDCIKQTPGGDGRILLQHICAMAKLGGHSSCQGDSGGPMAMKEKNGNYVLLGVTSFGWQCSDGSPGVYARTSYYLSWIAKITGLKL